MTEEALMKLIADELRRQEAEGGLHLYYRDDDADKVIDGIRQLARAILAAVEVKLPLVDLGKGDKLP